MGSGSSTKGGVQKGEVVADVILPGQKQAVTVRGRVAESKADNESVSSASSFPDPSARPLTASRSRPVSAGRSKTPMVASKETDFHRPSSKLAGSDHIRPKSGSAQKTGTATVTEVAPNRYTVEYDNQVFDISSGDFSSFLANTAEMNVTNTETVLNPFLEGGSGRSFQVQLVQPKSGDGPLQVQLPQRGGADMAIEDLEEDVEDILEPLDNKEYREPDNKKSERKETLRQALQVKKTQLSKEEYEQMIANHKQEVELMELIRNKEKNRQKLSLEEKMNKRKLRKKRLAAEKREKALLEAGQDDSEIDENKKREIEAEIAKRNAEFERELQQKKNLLSEADLEIIIAEHKQNMIELNRDLERAEERQKQALAQKLAARKAKRAAWNAEKSKLSSDVTTDAVVSIASDSDDDIEVINDRIKRLQREIDRRESRFATDVVNKKRDIPEDEYQRLVDEHKKEMQRLVRKLENEKQRQRQVLQDKLGARQRRKKEETSPLATQESKEEDEARIAATEAEDVERQIERTQSRFEEEIEKKKPLISEEEYQRLLTEHQQEMDRLSKKLDRNKERQRLALLEKLAERKRKRNMKTTEDEERAKLLAALKNKEVLTEEQLKMLEGDITQYSAEYQDELNKKKSQISQEEYDRLLAQHKKDVNELDKKLQQEKDKMRKSLEEKLAERKARGKKRGQKDTPEDAELQEIEEDIADIKVDMERKQEEFDAKIKNRGQMSDDDYAKLIAEHEAEMEKLRKKLERQKDRQRQKLLEKIAARKKKKDMKANEEEQRAKLLAALQNKETLDEAQLKMLQDDIEQYDKDITKAISKKFDKGDITQEEYEAMMAKHQHNMEELHAKLRQEKSRLNAMLAAEVAELQGRKMSDNEDDDDDEFNIEPPLATETSLWTTPVQSQTNAMVPLLDEYPVRKKKELYTDPAIFREQDAHAIRMAQTVSLVMEPTFSSLVDALVEPATSQLQKVRLVFRWITAQNCQEMDLHDAVDDTPLGVLKGIYEDKITWSTLFMRMCRYVGLKCVEIAGCAKRVGYTPGQSISPDDEQYRHTWNAVCIDNYWHFVDCNWGVSHIQEAKTYDPFRYQYDEHYFLADPEVIIRTHFPNDQPWQLLRNPFTLQDFVEDILVKPDFFTYGFMPISHTKSLIVAENGELELKLSFTKGYIVSSELFTKQGAKAQTVNGIPYAMYIFQQQVAENVLSFYVRLPDPGIYYWVFYAKKHIFDGEINTETATEICRYMIDSRNPSSDRYPLPPCPLTHWGPITVEDYDLTVESHRNAVVMGDAMSVACQFRYGKPLQFHCDVSAYGSQDGQFNQYVLHSKAQGVVTFRFTPPVPGRFGFNLYILQPNGHITPFCSYLVVCREPKFNPTPFPFVPDNQWGPTPAFNAMGLCTLSHHEPVMEITDSDLNIELGYTSEVDIAFTFLHHFQQYRQDITTTVFCEPQNGKVTFLVFMERPGLYHLTLLAGDRQDPYGGKIPVFNYLMIKE